jgi:hypothetical protein
VLRTWVERDAPKAGDRVSIFYGGIDHWKSRSRHEYVAGIASRASEAEASW